MTARVSRRLMNPSYPRGQAEDNCPHAPEAHVVYDRLAAGYRAALRCGCGRVDVTSPRLHDGCAAAEAEAKWMLRRVIT